jgi:hypothetical protein
VVKWSKRLTGAPEKSGDGRGVSPVRAGVTVAVVIAVAAATVFAVSRFLSGSGGDPLASQSRPLTVAEKGEAEAAVTQLVQGGGTFGYDTPSGGETLDGWRELSLLEEPPAEVFRSRSDAYLGVRDRISTSSTYYYDASSVNKWSDKAEVLSLASWSVNGVSASAGDDGVFRQVNGAQTLSVTVKARWTSVQRVRTLPSEDGWGLLVREASYPAEATFTMVNENGVWRMLTVEGVSPTIVEAFTYPNPDARAIQSQYGEFREVQQ